MTPKKTMKADLERKKVLFLELGLIVSLSLAILVFRSGGEVYRGSPLPGANPVPYISVMAPVTTQEQKSQATVAPLNVSGTIIVTVPNDRMTIDVPELTDEPFDFGEFFGKGDPGAPDGYYGTIVPDDMPLFRVEDMPKFQGGDLLKFREWVGKRVVYPRMAAEMGITGKVVLSFVIERDGSLSQIEVLDSPDRLLAEEAVRILEQSPVWTPGYQNDIPARVRFTLPLNFELR